MEPKLISKEELKSYHFVNNEVLNDISDVKERSRQLNEAVRLGNEHKAKVKLICETTAGPVEVETTVWALTDNHIELKSGTDIPVKAIKKVIIY